MCCFNAADQQAIKTFAFIEVLTLQRHLAATYGLKAPVDF